MLYRNNKKLSTGFFVMERFDCPECNGNSVRQNPYWEKLHEHENNNITYTTIELDDWARLNGLKNADEMGTEFIVCKLCNGIGYLMREVGLQDALDALIKHG